MVLRWIGAGFAAFGLLVGTTAGLSSATLTTTLLGLLFALIGGSIGVFLGKLDADGRRLAGVGLLAFGVGAMVGLYSGLYVRINDLLRSGARPPTVVAGTPAPTPRVSEYLKSRGIDLVPWLKAEIISDRKSLPDACRILDEESRGGKPN